ncbi:chromate transporter [Hydrogenophaga taeniospiralis]|jgi:chromate transporter|uniref:chromate transporter n=1 Tax=Hydrogenophaga taeniospiralis TaxID=65656 RepID=UPI001CFA8876|nr:chromate transporter [Hydrogenophaga taeniospiralis]MCB4365586.1 chromate transporter [Hydrogenophaga taeniospiralis]
MTNVQAFAWSDLPSLCLNFATLSLISVGGGMAVVPDMHRFLVLESRWLTASQFSDSVALAQVAPGPNILFVALMGWYASSLSLGVWAAPLVATLCLLCMVGPSSVLALYASRWMERHHEVRSVKAFHNGLAPVVVALLFSSAVYVYPSKSMTLHDLALAVLCLTAFVLLLKTRVNLMLLLAAGATAGALGLV